MLKIIKEMLLATADRIDSGNTNITEEEQIKLIDMLNRINDNGMSKYQAYNYLNMSRSSFDNMVAEGKLPQGKKVAGFKELRWYKTDLDKYVTKRK